jgi:hypothetical protein
MSPAGHLGAIAERSRSVQSDLLTREQANKKSYPAEQIDGLKRVFEADGMIVTGPPLDLDSNSRRRRANDSVRDEFSRPAFGGMSASSCIRMSELW